VKVVKFVALLGKGVGLDHLADCALIVAFGLDVTQPGLHLAAAIVCAMVENALGL